MDAAVKDGTHDKPKVKGKDVKTPKSSDLFKGDYEKERGGTIDDTENSERIHTYHKSGTYEEIDANGTKVTRIIGDKYEILERNGHLYIKGSADVTIDGDHHVKINNALNISHILFFDSISKCS